MALTVETDGGTVLAVQDSTDGSAVRVFETLVFYAEYSLQEGSETVPIEGAVCLLSDHLTTDWVEMSYDHGNQRFEAGRAYVHPGEYEALIQCGAEDQTIMQAAESFTVSGVEGRVCAVDAYFDKNVPVVENTGNWEEQVTYTLTVNSIPDTETVVLEAGETVNPDYAFGEGTYQVGLEAEAACGARDTEGMTYQHIVHAPYTCSGPYGVEGQNHCDYQNRQVLVCSAGSWVDSGLPYCYSCPSTCGDGVPNCGETKQTCSQDFRCSPGFTDSYRCSGDWLQREYRHADYTTKWVDYEKCSHGCGSGACALGPEACQVSIESFDHTDSVTEDRNVRAEVTVSNTGIMNSEVTVTLYVDGEKEQAFVEGLDAGESAAKRFYFQPGAGTHDMIITATSGCGAEDHESAAVTVYHPVRLVSAPQPVTHSHSTGTAPAQVATSVGFPDRPLDVELNKARIVPVEIETSRPQAFSISVTGLPADWVSHNSQEYVNAERAVYLYVSPKAVGSHSMHITVRALEEGLTFASDLELYVADPAGTGSQDALGTGYSQFKNQILMLFAAPNMILASIVAVFIFVLAVGGLRLREEPLF
jgi:hypothetical protein